MKKAVIYKITSPSGKYYIGKTIDFGSRMATYKNLNNSQQKAIHASILKYGWENHVVEILEEATPSNLDQLEIKYIKELNSFSADNPLGLNLTRGGSGTPGRVDTRDAIDRRIKKCRGSKRSETTKKLMSERKKGKIPFASTLPRTEKQLQHSKFGNIGRKKSQESIEKEKATKLAKFLKEHGGILQIDLEGTTIKEWKILPKYVAKQIQVDVSSLLAALKSDLTKTSKKHFWKYKNKFK